MSEELWQEIPEFSNYMISNLGNVYNIKHKHVMRTSRTQHGHVKITLKDDYSDDRYCRSVARMVAQAFVEAPNHMCDEVIVLDGDFSNVAAINLAWRPYWYAYKYTRQMKTVQPVPFQNLAVRNTTTGYVYNSIIEAGVTEGLLFEDIWRSTHSEARLFPYGHAFEIIDRV